MAVHINSHAARRAHHSFLWLGNWRPCNPTCNTPVSRIITINRGAPKEATAEEADVSLPESRPFQCRNKHVNSRRSTPHRTPATGAQGNMTLATALSRFQNPFSFGFLRSQSQASISETNRSRKWPRAPHTIHNHQQVLSLLLILHTPRAPITAAAPIGSTANHKTCFWLAAVWSLRLGGSLGSRSAIASRSEKSAMLRSTKASASNISAPAKAIGIRAHTCGMQ